MSGDHAKKDFADGMVEPIIPWSAVSAGTCFWPPAVALARRTVTVDGGSLAI